VLCYAAARVAPAPARARVCMLPVLPRIVLTCLPAWLLVASHSGSGGLHNSITSVCMVWCTRNE
jgi:hypothetical protein